MNQKSHFANLSRAQAERLLRAEFTQRRNAKEDAFATAREFALILADPLSFSDLSLFRVECVGGRHAELGGRIVFSAR